MLWGIYSAIYGEVNVSVEKYVEIKGRLCWITKKLFYFCHLKKLVRPETFGPYYVHIVGWCTVHTTSKCYVTFHKNEKKNPKYGIRFSLNARDLRVENYFHCIILGIPHIKTSLRKNTRISPRPTFSGYHEYLVQMIKWYKLFVILDRYRSTLYVLVKFQ